MLLLLLSYVLSAGKWKQAQSPHFYQAASVTFGTLWRLRMQCWFRALAEHPQCTKPTIHAIYEHEHAFLVVLILNLSKSGPLWRRLWSLSLHLLQRSGGLEQTLRPSVTYRNLTPCRQNEPPACRSGSNQADLKWLLKILLRHPHCSSQLLGPQLWFWRAAWTVHKDVWTCGDITRWFGNICSGA